LPIHCICCARKLGKNVNVYFFRAFIKELRNELRDKPKRSRFKSNQELYFFILLLFQPFFQLFFLVHHLS
jgi:hypothetical protein